MTRQALAVPLLAAVVVGGVGAWVTAEVPSAHRASVGLFCGVAAVLLCVVAAFASARAQAVRRLQARLAAVEADAARRTAAMQAEVTRRTAVMEAEAAKLADETIPSAVGQLREGETVDTVLSTLPAPASGAHDRVLKMLVREVATGERMRASAMAACANAAGRVQALATSMLADLREMENRHDEAVLGDLLKLDHTTAQAGRIADSIAVLTGARSGRRWTKPIVMESVLRGAVGRISAYQRVRIHSASTAAVAGYAAEGVMHALAELMDNAATFSPPTEEVHVYVQETHTGVVVTVEDGGLVMGPAALARAEKAVSSDPLDLTTLSGTRLGLAVVGQLARKHNLTVSFRPSSRGGTGVVVLIPQQLITHVSQDAATNPAPATRSSAARPATPQATNRSAAPTATPTRTAAPAPAGAPDPGPAAAPQPTSAESTGGLPKRRRGETLAAASRPAAPQERKAPSDRPRPDATRLGAFRQAARGGAPCPAAESAPCADDQAAEAHATPETSPENDQP
ncbi:ATP-binding protein [Streptomyces sp. NBS 14/10]|uniref:sensor histidine kinase n=1 Tax=Streptomyces sp. NBS 14/10 TaxID=1945643 RepID=UPI000B7DE4EC|nr:ATP-binding protein [Streptomyces sp. NBS 14/10]KAK1181065.1 ATP-binding protein [Streptomyces sp. NBS 14/10]